MAATLTLPSSSDSRTLSYSLDDNNINGPIVLLANPLCAPYSAWDHVVRHLNENGFRTLRYDQPGHGLSSAPARLDSTTFESIADDVRFLLAELGIPKLHAWIGVSMGGATGVRFVTKYPGVVGKLAICDSITASPINEGIQDAFGPRVAAAREVGNLNGTIQSTLERWFGKAWLEQNRQEALRMQTIMSATSMDGFETCCHALRSPTFDLRPLLGQVGSSVDDAVCVVGENDANLPQTMALMRDQVEDGFKAAGREKLVDLVVIEDAGHVSFVDGFHQFVQFMVGWLNRG
ncbi:Alpha/Beta hydrolase protein [Mariannaea sp. PMI_226]|nr:Alpha/Beta hydrolase protein [Mariannaea sp. PMI_226]